MMNRTPWHFGSVAVSGILVFTAGCAATDGTEPTDADAEVASADWSPPPLPEGSADPSDPGALLRRTAEFIKSQPQLGIEAMITFGAAQESGQTLHFDVLEWLAIQRPDKLAWVTLNDDGTVEQGWLLDGRFTLLKQPANMWGSVSVPSAIPAAVDRLADWYDLDVPFEELLSADLVQRWGGDGQSSLTYVGEEWVHGSWTDHVAMRRPGVDFEIWIRQGPEPFPAKMMVTLTEEEGTPSWVARFRTWSTMLSEGDATFEFTAPADAQKVEVAPVIRP